FEKLVYVYHSFSFQSIVKHFENVLILQIVAIFCRVFGNFIDFIITTVANFSYVNLCNQWIFCDLLPQFEPPIPRNIIIFISKITFIYGNQNVKMWVVIVTLFVVRNF